MKKIYIPLFLILLFLLVFSFSITAQIVAFSSCPSGCAVEEGSCKPYVTRDFGGVCSTACGSSGECHLKKIGDVCKINKKDGRCDSECQCTVCGQPCLTKDGEIGIKTLDEECISIEEYVDNQYCCVDEDCPLGKSCMDVKCS